LGCPGCPTTCTSGHPCKLRFQGEWRCI